MKTPLCIDVYYKFGIRKNTPYPIRVPFTVHGHGGENPNIDVIIDFDSVFFRKSQHISDFVSLMFSNRQSPDLTDNGLVRYMDKQSCFMKNYNSLIRLKNKIVDVLDNNTDDSWTLELFDPMHSAFQILPKINPSYSNGNFDYITVPFIKKKETLPKTIYKEIVNSNSHKFDFIKNIDIGLISDDIKPISISRVDDLCYVPEGSCMSDNGEPLTSNPTRIKRTAMFERIAD